MLTCQGTSVRASHVPLGTRFSHCRVLGAAVTCGEGVQVTGDGRGPEARSLHATSFPQSRPGKPATGCRQRAALSGCGLEQRGSELPGPLHQNQHFSPMVGGLRPGMCKHALGWGSRAEGRLDTFWGVEPAPRPRSRGRPHSAVRARCHGGASMAGGRTRGRTSTGGRAHGGASRGASKGKTLLVTRRHGRTA